ncbi:globin [Maribellus comscasis]|uniref:Globin n=1 Tax=Maribellus comscasis TaxID=2681766 RepID=A0A6I6JUC8_9BACT|nr:globin [Maribellus comscasis]QGY43777.1 globin [Maribellus comscasis]
MEFIISKYTPGNRPDVQLPSSKMFSMLGEEGIRELVFEHYDLLAKSSIKDLFPQDKAGLEKAKKNSSDFFIQVCGGPMYFTKHRGKPMLYKRHLPHKITAEAREVWLNCYKTALGKRNLPEDVLQSFWHYLDIFSIWMVNA